MSDKPSTELYERVAGLEKLIDGGPGEHPMCKRHAEDVKTIKESVDKLTAKVQWWSGGLAILIVFLNIAAPFLRDIASKLIKGP